MNPQVHSSYFLFLHISFSNSLIIHAEKTKEITTVKEVWICDLNYHKIWWTFALISPRIINGLRSYIKHSKGCFIRHPNTLKLVKKNSAAPRFLNHFSVFGYRMKHSSSCLIYYFIKFKTWSDLLWTEIKSICYTS